MRAIVPPPARSVRFHLFRRISAAILPILLGAAAADEPSRARLYAVTTETGMPHLEENLRYTTTHTRHCLTDQHLFEAFPILTHPALAGCKPGNRTQKDDTVSYPLVCANATTGAALWHVGERQVRGTLSVKLGGKNMTFYQRVTAVPLGNCSSR